METTTYGFIGAGNMAWAIFQKLLKTGVPAVQVTVSAPTLRNLQRWKDTGANITHQNGDVYCCCDVIFLAMKPQQFLKDSNAWNLSHSHAKKYLQKLVISVLAGVTLAVLRINLENNLKPFGSNNEKIKIVRVMPNTPLLVGFGCSVFCYESICTKEDVEFVQSVLSGGGSLAEEISEDLMDSAGAIAGCGPAYFYQMLEAMADGAVKKGLPRALASTLSAQTMLGAAQMVLQTGKNPAQLKDEVCSPGGTTIAGLYALKKAPNFNVAVMDAIVAASERGKEISMMKVLNN